MAEAPVLGHEALPWRRRRLHQQGMTLIELIVAMVILGVAAVGILVALQSSLRYSADPLVRRQALAVAESLLEEISSRPITLLDLHDLAAAIPNGIGPETATGETRTSPTVGFDNVDDYAGYTQQGTLTDAAGNAWPLIGQYASCVIVSPPLAAVGGVDASEWLQIQVNIFGPGGGGPPATCDASAMLNAAPLVRLEALRARYDPSS